MQINDSPFNYSISLLGMMFMISVDIKKSYKFRVKGCPTTTLTELEKPKRVAMLPEKIPGIKPKLKIKVDEKVKIGDPLFFDKKNPKLTFLSPGAGKISNITYGKRRVIREIEIRLDDQETFAEFPTLTLSDLKTITREDLIDSMLNGGMWPYIRSLPYRMIADPNDFPKNIIVTIENNEPFHPNPDVYLIPNLEYFKMGMEILKKLAEHSVVGSDLSHPLIREQLKNTVTHHYSGYYPAEDPGVMLYHIKTSDTQNLAWYISGQDVIQIGKFFKHGRYPIERIVTLGGSLAIEKKHFKTRIGLPVKLLTEGRVQSNEFIRYIAGGVFRGYSVVKDSYLGFYETALNLLSEEEKEETFGFLRFGYSRPSFSKTFLSSMNQSELKYDCGLHGEERACVNCGYCAKVCPVDILPQFTLKCIVADEVEEALSHGLLDCVECGICSYTCPSKIELCSVFRKAKMEYYKEINS